MKHVPAHRRALAALVGPVLLNGQLATMLAFNFAGQKWEVTASQHGAPKNARFYAQADLSCESGILIAAPGQAVPPVQPARITSTGGFMITALRNNLNCVVTISSSAGGQPARVTIKSL